MELLPTKATFAPGEPIVIEVRGDTVASCRLWHLDRLVAKVAVAEGEPLRRFAPQPEGGYGVEGDGAAHGARRARGPALPPALRLRLATTRPAGVEGVADNVRRLHLNAVQFYDWMYRHAQLLPPAGRFEDALGRELSLDTVAAARAAVGGAARCRSATRRSTRSGGRSGPTGRRRPLRPDGTPWMLGDFLWNVDPTNERWVAHFIGDLRAALDRSGSPAFTSTSTARRSARCARTGARSTSPRRSRR